MSELSLSASVMIGLGLQVETLDKLPIITLDEQIILTQLSAMFMKNSAISLLIHLCAALGKIT